MDARIWAAFVIFGALFGLSFATVTPCSDGTPYGECSNATPGYRCLLDGLKSRSGPSYADSPGLRCACPSGWTYNSTDDMCKRASCTVGGVTKNNGQCFDASKPKYCDAGTVVDKASACGCPAGEQAAGDSCTPISGYCTMDENCGSPAKKCTNNSCVSNLNQLGDNNSTDSGTSSAGGLACCAPAAGMILIGAFAFSRKQKKW